MALGSENGYVVMTRVSSAIRAVWAAALIENMETARTTTIVANRKRRIENMVDQFEMNDRRNVGRMTLADSPV